MKANPSLILAGLLLVALQPLLTQAQPVTLSGTWTEYDLAQILNGAPGNLQLSAQSASGFTAQIKTNAVDVNPADGVGDAQARPRIYQEFRALPFTNIGSRVTLSFDVVFNNAVAVQDTGWRYGFVTTNIGLAFTAQLDLGAPAGTTVRIRHDDDGISLTNGVTVTYTPGDWSDFGDFNNTRASSSGTPNSVGLNDTTTVHSLRFVLERVTGGLQQLNVWSNSAGTATVITTTPSIFDDVGTGQPWTSVAAVGFWCNNNDMFNGVGSYTISNLNVTYGFPVTAVRDNGTGEVTLTWASLPIGPNTFTVEYSSDLTTWNDLAASLPSGGLTTQYTDTAAASAPIRFYRIRVQP